MEVVCTSETSRYYYHNTHYIIEVSTFHISRCENRRSNVICLRWGFISFIVHLWFRSSLLRNWRSVCREAVTRSRRSHKLKINVFIYLDHFILPLYRYADVPIHFMSLYFTAVNVIYANKINRCSRADWCSRNSLDLERCSVRILDGTLAMSAFPWKRRVSVSTRPWPLLLNYLKSVSSQSSKCSALWSRLTKIPRGAGIAQSV
jgi:hypothetical protein